MKNRHHYMHYLMWGCAVLYYLYQYTIRVSPSIMMEDIMSAFHVSAHGFASLSALAMYSYAILQIPAGILTDTFGAKKVILVSICSCMIGLTCFACAEDLVLASVGRVLIGCGSAAAFLGVNKIGGDWFPSGRRAFVFGLTMTAGTIGALNGGAPLAALNQAAGWRWSLVYLAVIGAVIFFINLIFLKASPQTITREQNLKMSEIFSQIKSALGNLQVFITGIVALGVYMAISVLADLWGVSYLVQTYHVAKTTAAQAASLIYVGLCVGALIVSWWSDKIHKRKIFIVILSFMIAFCLTLFLYLESLPFWGSCILLFVIGFCSGAEMLCFALATEIVPRKITGTVTGYINAIVTLGGAFVQQQVGKILDHIWCGQCTDDGLRFYSAAEYKQALSLVIAVVLFTAILSLFLKERKHRSA
jgi:sugar phosphate permease